MEIDIAKIYQIAMDSVAVINGEKHENETNEEWADTLKRNKDHLIIMLAKDYWTNEDLTPFRDAVLLATTKA